MQCQVDDTGCHLRGAIQHKPGHNTLGALAECCHLFLVEGTDMLPDSFKKCHVITNAVFEKSTDSKLYLKLPYFASILFYSISGIACLFCILLFIWRCNNSRTVAPLSPYANIFMSAFKNLILNNIHVSVRRFWFCAISAVYGPIPYGDAVIEWSIIVAPMCS